MDDISGDADELGAYFLPVIFILGIVLIATLIYCVVSCVKNVRA